MRRHSGPYSLDGVTLADSVTCLSKGDRLGPYEILTLVGKLSSTYLAVQGDGSQPDPSATLLKCVLL
jgi:hypothetical protein